ncbi:hypothetical protein ACC734_39450, partial [Rhizobium ruizarguesonis]
CRLQHRLEFGAHFQAEQRVEVRKRLVHQQNLWFDGKGTTTIYVNHDQTEAMGLSDRIAVMHGGVVEQVGHPVEIYNHPAT